MKPRKPKPYKTYEEVEAHGWYIYIPVSKFGVQKGYYSQRDIVELLRYVKSNPNAVQYVADMME